MKKITILAIAFLGYVNVSAQINSGAVIDLNPNKNTFIDASEYTQTADVSAGRGINFPRTDLTRFKFDISDLGQYQYFKTGFDGFIVYNTGEGKTGNELNTQGIVVDVKPGFYYFSNPTATEDSTDVSTGKWVRIGGEVSTSVAGANVATGIFTHDGSNKSVLGNNVPTDLKAITSIKIARIDDNGAKLEGGVAATTFYSYDKATRTIVFGQGPISTSMPAGEYSYTIEYTK